MKRFRWLLAAAVVVITASALAGVAQPHFGRAADTPAPGTTITVTATGTAQTTPDRASFQFGVDSRASTAREALAKNAAAATKMIDALKAAGVPASDIQTTGVWLSPRTATDGTVTGYEASNSVSAKTIVAKSGPLVDAAVAAGATNVWGPSLLVADEDALYRDALKNAVATAAAEAGAMAAASGLTLGAPRTISEGSQAQPYPIAGNNAGAAATPGGAAPTTPIETGTQSMSATVTVTYNAS
jgi:uncharacterized protein YggE